MKWLKADTGKEEHIIEVNLLGFKDLPQPSEDTDVPLDERLRNRSGVFQNVLFDYIDRSGYRDSYIYKKAGIDRKYFSKIRSKRNYVPKKNTVIALGLALNLEIEDMETLLCSAGYALMPSGKLDIIIRYCIEHEIYNVRKVNDLLYKYTGKTL